MLAKRSPLKLNELALLQSYYRFVDPEDTGKPVDIAALFETYPIDIDFVIKQPKDGMRQVFTKVMVNWPEDGPAGYRLFVEAVGLFSISGEADLKPQIRNNLAHYSTVNMMINWIRAHMTTLTASSPMGSFVLPAVDITDLFKKKAERGKQAAKRKAS